MFGLAGDARLRHLHAAGLGLAARLRQRRDARLRHANRLRLAARLGLNAGRLPQKCRRLAGRRGRGYLGSRLRQGLQTKLTLSQRVRREFSHPSIVELFCLLDTEGVVGQAVGDRVIVVILDHASLTRKHRMADEVCGVADGPGNEGSSSRVCSVPGMQCQHVCFQSTTRSQAMLERDLRVVLA